MNTAPRNGNRLPGKDFGGRGGKFPRVKKNGEKFVPSYKKKMPNWKLIESEIAELAEKYDQVSHFLKTISLKNDTY